MTKFFFVIKYLRIGALAMKEILITFPDGSTKSYPQGTTYETISKDYPGKYAYVAAKVDNVIFSLDDKVENDSNVSLTGLTLPF